MKIPTKTGKSTDEKDAESDCCAICIEAYKASDLIRVLPCRHEFHKNCIDPWLIEHRTCPMCKLDVLKFYGYVVGDEIHTTPTPRHVPANNRTPLEDTDVPVIVVLPSIPPPQSSPLQPSTSLSSSSSSSPSPASPLSSPPLATASRVTATALAAINSNNIPSRFSATQASVETQTITTIEPHSSREDIATHLQNYHKTPPPPSPSPSPSTSPASTAIIAAMPAAVDHVASSYNYHLSSNSSSSSNSHSHSSNSNSTLANSNNSQACCLSFPQAQQQTQVNTGSHLVTDV